MAHPDSRYSRHLIMPDFTAEHQERLRAARILLIGAGGLSVPLAQYLVGAGIGSLTVLDADTIGLSNLHRQPVYKSPQVGELKAIALATHLRALNPEVEVTAHTEAFLPETAPGWVAAHDVVLDGADNFAATYLANDTCVQLGKALVTGAVYRWEGQLGALAVPLSGGGRSCDYRDLFPTPPDASSVDTCATGGVLGPVPGVIGAWMAVLALQLAASMPCQPNRWTRFDGQTGRTQTVHLLPNPANPLRHHPINEGLLARAYAPRLPVIQWAEFEAWCRQHPGAQLVDVRTLPERQAHHHGGVHWPLQAILQQEPPPDYLIPHYPTALYCATGKRAAQAAAALHQQGWEKVFALGPH